MLSYKCYVSYDFNVLSSDVLKALSDPASMQLFKEIATRQSVDSDSLMSTGGLTKKQYYTRLQRLSQRGLVSRKNGSLSVTSFGKIIHDCKLKIDSAVAEYYSLRAVDAFNDSKEINNVQRKELIQKIITDGKFQSILLE